MQHFEFGAGYSNDKPLPSKAAACCPFDSQEREGAKRDRYIICPAKPSLLKSLAASMAEVAYSSHESFFADAEGEGAVAKLGAEAPLSYQTKRRVTLGAKLVLDAATKELGHLLLGSQSGVSSWVLFGADGSIAPPKPLLLWVGYSGKIPQATHYISHTESMLFMRPCPSGVLSASLTPLIAQIFTPDSAQSNRQAAHKNRRCTP